MTDNEINKAIAEACGVADRWVIMKRGLYYRPNANGYTNRIEEAWVVTEDVADKHTYPHDEPVTKHPALVPDYLNDLNACHEMEMELPTEKRHGDKSYAHYLWQLSGHPFEGGSTWYVLHATARQRCEAFLKTLNLWHDQPKESAK